MQPDNQDTKSGVETKVSSVLSWSMLAVVTVAFIIFLQKILLKAIPGLVGSDQKSLISQLCFLVFASLAMILLNRTKRFDFGFRRPAQFPWLAIVLGGLIPGALGSAGVIALGGSGLGDMSSAPSLLFFITLFLIAPLCEEVLLRGLAQGLMTPISNAGISIGKLRFSVPVIISGLMFSAMHLSLRTSGVGWNTVLPILAFTFALGIIAGYQREKSGSLLSAITVHIFGNIGGVLGGMIIMSLMFMYG